MCRPAGKAAERIYFKAGDVVGISAHAIPLNREVSFVMVPDPRGRQDVAANVQLLPSTLQADQLIPETGGWLACPACQYSSCVLAGQAFIEGC